MNLRTRLILAFVVLAVVPLGVVILYSYNSSLIAFRRAVEAESGAVAEEIGSRMESVRADLNHRMRRLSEFPFRRLMTMNSGGGGKEHAPLRDRLLSEIGDAAPFVEALEFTPMPEAAPKPPAAPPAMIAVGPGGMRLPPPPPPPKEAVPDGLVIQLDTGPAQGPFYDEKSLDEAKRVVMHLHIPGSSPQQIERHRQAVADAARIAEEFRRSAEAAAKSAEFKAAISAATSLATTEAGRQVVSALGQSFAYSVQTDGEVVGTVKAQISSRRVLRSVLSRTRRKQGEIPFAIDAQNEIHTADAADKAVLDKLPIPGTGKASAPSPVQDWIVVTRKDQDSGVTFGIARPIGDSLKEIRRTAARNLGFGMGVIGLALIGILPLSGRMTRNLATLTDGVEQLARGNLDARVPVRSSDEFGRLSQAFNRMAQDLQLHEKNLVEQERLRKELEMCRKIQEELLPHQPLCSPFVEVKGVSIPAREVGGDFFNYFPLDGGNVGLLVGDVSGKGLPAALLMANLQATIQARLPLEPDLARLADQLDRDIDASTPPELYLTLFMGVFDVARGSLRYVNAGHHTQFALVPGGNVHKLESTGRPLGLLPGGGYQEKSVDLPPGSRLFLYTDGLVESENEHGEQFGMARLETLLLSNRGDDPDGMLADIDAAIRAYRGPVEAADDATMLVLNVDATKNSA
jgi:serine phosphatase RsbU (regulator of sigma subunit)